MTTADVAPPTVSIVEVGPRDGLQNAPGSYSTASRAAFIEALVEAGVTTVETCSFVSPTAVPKMADADEVVRCLKPKKGVRYIALVPNERGYDRATTLGMDSIGIFTSATEAFCQANLRATVDATFDRFQPISRRAATDNVWLRGYISVAFGCPFSGPVDPSDVVSVALRLVDLGCQEIVLADTIGTANPTSVRAVLDALRSSIPYGRLALHSHDTAGQAIANIDAALAYGVTNFDSAAGGMGGCPFAPGAPGNVSTEQLIEHLHGRGIATKIDPEQIRRAGEVLHTGRDSLVGSAG
jgi:isopropylmalate/homocitrate/citramalate synthase